MVYVSVACVSVVYVSVVCVDMVRVSVVCVSVVCQRGVCQCGARRRSQNKGKVKAIRWGATLLHQEVW